MAIHVNITLNIEGEPTAAERRILEALSGGAAKAEHFAEDPRVINVSVPGRSAEDVATSLGSAAQGHEKPKAEKPKRTRMPKPAPKPEQSAEGAQEPEEQPSEPEVAPEPAEDVAEPETAAEPAEEAEPTESRYPHTAEGARDLAMALVRGGHRDAVKAKLKDLGVPKVLDLEGEDLEAFFAGVEPLLDA